ncbi:DUF3304 domain-containing protein [Paraburkholderia graminis]|jgi:hypothetical protein
MTMEKTVAAAALLVVMCGCATGEYRGSVRDAGLEAANYTENYITDFSIGMGKNKNLRFAGTEVKQFSKGGTGGGVCCFSGAGPGEEVMVEWRTGKRDDPESQWARHSTVTRAIGSAPDDPHSNVTFIVRFFPGDRVEGEYVVQELKPDSTLNPRFDALFSGRLVMRHVGE